MTRTKDKIKNIKNIEIENENIDEELNVIENVLNMYIVSVDAIKKTLINVLESYNIKLIIRAVENNRGEVFLEFLRLKEKKIKIKKIKIVENTKMNDNDLLKKIMDTIIHYLNSQFNLSYKKIYYINTLNFIKILSPKYVNKYIYLHYENKKAKTKKIN